MFKLASSIGLALALAELKQRVRRLVAQGILGAIGAVIFLIGVCFLLVAAHLYLSSLLTPIASAAIIGGALLVVALILFLVASLMRSRPARRMPTPANAAEDGVARLTEAVGSKSLANPALVIAGLALLLGFVFGRRAR